VRPGSAAEILRELVGIASPSAVSNLPLLAFVKAQLEPLGWQVYLLPYQDDAGVEKANLIAWPGSYDLPERFDLAFICHTDTVPYSERWPAALTLQERGGHLHGCGACDVKGALACFLAAVAGILPARLNPRIGLILTADEEIGCKGMDRLLASTEMRIGSAIVSEPTSLRAGVAGKGYGLARVSVEGREAHSAFPGQGVSAISVAARLIAAIDEGLAPDLPGSLSDSLFDPPRTTVNVGVIHGGTAKNIVAGRCEFLVEWRAIPGQEQAEIVTRLNDLAAAAREAEPRAQIEVEVLRAEAGFSPAETGPLRRKLAELLEGEPMGISFGSEASRVARIADEVIVIGPGDMRTAHSERECVPVAELESWTAVLRELLTQPVKA
jgi:acetylornithine deacetylase